MSRYLYRVTIQPRQDGEFTPVKFNIEAQDLAEAAEKVNLIPDIDYLYDPDRYDLLFSRDGYLY